LWAFFPIGKLRACCLRRGAHSSPSPCGLAFLAPVVVVVVVGLGGYGVGNRDSDRGIAAAPAPTPAPAPAEGKWVVVANKRR